MVKGHNQTQIGHILQVSEATISNDVGYLRARARQDMETHLYDRLPQEFEHCLSGINQILKMSWEIATRDYQGSDSADKINSSTNSDKTLSSRVDDKTRLQALALANDCYKYKIDLVTNGVVVANAVKFVQQKKEELHRINDNKIGAANPNSSEYPTKNKVF